MLSSLLYFIAYSIPPVAGWWLCFKAPLGRRRIRLSALIAAPPEAVFARLDPRNSSAAWNPHYEIRNETVLSQEPLTIAKSLRPRHSEKPFKKVVSACEVDKAGGRIATTEISTDDKPTPAAEARTTSFLVAEERAGTLVTLTHESRMTGLLNYELIRLGLARHLSALQDALVGRDARATPCLRFSGWRMAWFGLLGALALIAMMLAPAFYMAFEQTPAKFLLASGVDMATLAAFAALVLVFLLYLTALLVLAILIHELGHALAMVAFGHRGVTVSLIPFGGGVALSWRDHASAFEAGVVALAGPLLGALAALALLPDPAAASGVFRHLFGGAAAPAAATSNIAAGFAAVSGVIFAFLTLLLNVPNLLPWTGSDGAQALRATFSSRGLRILAAVAVTALLATTFGGLDDLPPFGLFFLALTWWNRKHVKSGPPGAPTGGERVLVASVLALTVALYAHEATTLRRIGWLPEGAAETTLLSGGD